ncbi:DNA cytosine methyltransferase [Catellatospora tritici]|uniref:DNA cytosine methyltransferase n=1 Tax=Catellatospora tritici TaxID=2851566 RepID=UPI001C2CF165|nr:DNA (cytosine-5-)-methyltransferase [Catellatospora tritici]MBV1849356.1 DNA (cytosine-5-)-methyltransferase [Catellatospora tritici]
MARSVELFAGGGGMALGMLSAGFEHDQLVEIMPIACETLRQNAERDPLLWKTESVREMDVRSWLLESETRQFEGVDLVAGGPPCQPFSIGAGDKADHANERNMFPAAADSISLLRPKAFVFENVPGLLRELFLPYYEYIIDRLTKPSISPKPDEDWVSHHARIRKSKTKAEYEVRVLTLDAADLGIAQTRRRIFIIGVRADVAKLHWFEGVSLTHSRDGLIHSQWITGEYWKKHSIVQPEMPARFASKVKEIRNSGVTPAGEPWQTTRDAITRFPAPVDGIDTPGILNHKGIPGARTYRGHTGGWIEWPAKTLKAGVHGVCGGEAMIRFSDDSLRYLTIREAAAVQSFPDSYQLPDVRTAAMRLVGNAVAVEAAAAVGRRLHAIVTGLPQESSASTLNGRVAHAVHAAEISAMLRRRQPSRPGETDLAEGLW